MNETIAAGLDPGRRRRAGRAVAAGLAGDALEHTEARLLAGFVSAIVVANVLAKDSYGAVVTIGAMATTYCFADLGIERGLTKFLPEIESRHGRRGVARTLQAVIGLKLPPIAVTLGLALISATSFSTTGWAWASQGQGRRHPRDNRPLPLGLLLGADGAGAARRALRCLHAGAHRLFQAARLRGRLGFVVQVLSPLLRIAVVLIGGTLGFVGALVAVPLVATMMAAWQTSKVRRELQERPTQEAAGACLPQRLGTYTGLSYWQEFH